MKCLSPVLGAHIGPWTEAVNDSADIHALLTRTLADVERSEFRMYCFGDLLRVLWLVGMCTSADECGSDIFGDLVLDTDEFLW